MSIAKIKNRVYSEEIKEQEELTGFKWGPRMHHYDGGVFIDCTFHKKGPKWWVVKDHPATSKFEKRFALNENYYYLTYELNL